MAGIHEVFENKLWERSSTVRDGDGVVTRDEGNGLGEEKVEEDGAREVEGLE